MSKSNHLFDAIFKPTKQSPELFLINNNGKITIEIINITEGITKSDRLPFSPYIRTLEYPMLNAHNI